MIAGSFFGARAWKERAVKHGEFWLARWIGNDGGEKAGILVVHITEFDAFARRKSSKSQTLPMEKVFRHSQGNPGTVERPRRVCHQVPLKRFDKRDTRVFTASAAIRPQLIVGLRLKCDAQSFDTDRIADWIESHSGNAYARIIPASDEPREKIEFPIRAANSGWIQHALYFLRISRLWFHHHPQTAHLEFAHP